MEKETDIDHGMSPALGRVLQFCVVLAIVLFIIGLGLLFARNGGERIDEQLTLWQIIDSIAAIGPEGIIGLGVIVIVATPLIRIFTTTMLAVGNKDSAIAILTVLSLVSIILAFLVKTIA